MYTERSVELKSDFYSRYGSASGVLYFERVGLPFMLMRGGSRMLAFAADCGVRAYGRRCGDVLRILNSDSNVCDVHFRGSGEGAQILYKTDVSGFGREEETVDYTVDKLLVRMGLRENVSASNKRAAALCDEYGSHGWCAYLGPGGAKSLPLPLTDHNVIIVRVRKNGGKRVEEECLECFEEGEDRRIEAAAAGLKDCRPEILFDMMNESERAAEKLLAVSAQARYAAGIAINTDGVRAARVCEAGILCITDKGKTDSVAHIIREEFGRQAGYYAGIVVIK